MEGANDLRGLNYDTMQLEQVMVAHGLQRLGRPIQEPVDRGAVDERRVFHEVVLELVARGAHEKKQVEVALAPLIEEFVGRILRCVLNLGFLELLLDLIVNLLFIFRGKE